MILFIFLSLILTFRIVDGEIPVPNDARDCIAHNEVPGKCIPILDQYKAEKYQPQETTTTIPPSTSTVQTTLSTLSEEKFPCGRIYRFGAPYVFNGYEIDRSWVVGIFRKDRNLESPSSYRLLCGGSIVSENFILTAAHCVEAYAGGSISEIFVGIGSSKVNETIKVPIKEVILHPNYIATERYNDIALLKVSIKYSWKVSPICLPDSSTFNDTDEEQSYRVEVTGWGLIELGRFSRVLLAVDLEVISNQKCNQSYSEHEWIVPEGILGTQICAQDPQENSDACSGDSGGPMTRILSRNGFPTYYQIGIVSFGNGCANPDYPGVYTRVSEYIPWIREYLDQPQPTTVTPTPVPTPVPTTIPTTVQATILETVEEKIPCGKRYNKDPNSYVAGGYDVNSTYAWPWMAALFREIRNSGSKKSYQHVCGGSIVSENFILTAAHCVETYAGRRISELYVGIGSNEVDETIKVPIKEVILHPNYISTERYNDIALLITSDSIEYSPTIRPICLPESTLVNDADESSFDNIQVAGWGRLNRGGRSFFKLLAAYLDIRSNEKCDKSYSALGIAKLPNGIISTQLCAGTPGGERDSCSGDSGGPLSMRVPADDPIGNSIHYQIGIFSYAVACANPEYPGVFTRVSAYIPWIKEQLERSC